MYPLEPCIVPASQRTEQAQEVFPCLVENNHVLPGRGQLCIGVGFTEVHEFSLLEGVPLRVVGLQFQLP